MDNWSRLVILVATVVVGVSLVYLPLTQAANVMAGTLMGAAIVLGIIRQTRR